MFEVLTAKFIILLFGLFINKNFYRATSRQITLPDGYTCERCTLQLLRQASEWSAGRAQYIFWSCAEISIQEG